MDVNERESGGYCADLYQKQLLGEELEAAWVVNGRE